MTLPADESTSKELARMGPADAVTSEEPTRVYPARRVLHNRLLLALTASPLLLYVPLVVAMSRGEGRFIGLFFLPAVVAVFAAFDVVRRKPRPRVVAGAVRVGSATITLPDGQEVRRSAIHQGFVTAATSGEARVTLFGPRIPIELVVESDVAGRRLLAALALDATQTAVTFKGQSRIGTLPMRARVGGAIALWLPALGLIATALLAFGRIFGTRATGLICLFFGILMIFVPLVPLAVLARASRIAVGVDGIEILWLGRRRFVPFARVTRVELLAPDSGTNVSRGIALHLDDGERVALPLALSSLVEGEAQRLASRVEQAIAARSARPSGAIQHYVRVTDPVARVTALLRAGAGAGAGPRNPATDPELLLASMEDASVPAAARVEAAISLAGTGDAEHRERILRASRQVASPGLRVALERAAEPSIDEEALVEALAAVAEEEQAAMARRR